MYLTGDGVSTDYHNAFEWFSKAAEQGDIQAQFSLGFMYHKGQGVAQNYTKAVEWYSKAAEQGDAFAQFTLGFMYLSGLGVAQDNVLAYKWFNLAALQNDIDAVKNRDDLVKKMTPEQLSKAKQMSADWLAKQPQSK
jgi:TPR repeat protein